MNANWDFFFLAFKNCIDGPRGFFYVFRRAITALKTVVDQNGTM